MQLLRFWRNQWFVDFPQNLTLICLERPAIAGLFRFKFALHGVYLSQNFTASGTNQAYLVVNLYRETAVTQEER